MLPLTYLAAIFAPNTRVSVEVHSLSFQLMVDSEQLSNDLLMACCPGLTGLTHCAEGQMTSSLGSVQVSGAAATQGQQEQAGTLTLRREP